MDRLTAMIVFRKVVERGSFRLAAEQLSLSNASVSKYVSGLENHLGTPLLSRTTRRVSLTDAGRSYYAKCTRILEDLEEAESSAGQLQTAPRGLLKVRAPISLGAAHFGRTVAAFLARFPEVSVEMTLNDRFVDPAEEGVDVALLIASNVRDSSHVARPIARWARVLCAAPAYLAQHGEPATIADLKRRNCIIYTRGQAPDEWRFRGAAGERMVRVNGSMRCNNAMVLREALLEGIGIGLMPRFLVAGDLVDDRLRTPLPDWEPEPRRLYAVFPQQRSTP
ncbi:MAG TPA: LysR family transcriptional regulator, partial [Burkholderiales bacterium]|nr:LysR family transcriptional regulator [Burkholderiales bacterium]